MSQIIAERDLRKFCNSVFYKLGFTIEEADICTNVLVTADLRGITSHGVAALQRYINGIEEGIIIPKNKPHIISETPTSLLIDGNGAMGMISSAMATQHVIAKAKTMGMGIAAVKNSNHFGFGGYYAMDISNEDMIGLVLSNTAAIAVPTYGTQVKLGTNPISFAAPHNNGAFVLDMATTVVPRGVIKQFADNKKPIPEGWAIDETGAYITDPQDVLQRLSLPSMGGGLVLLGGISPLLGGHKGYGLGVMVDILTGLLSGFNASYQIKDTEKSAGRSSHTFIAIRIDTFRNIDVFKKDMDLLLSSLKQTAGTEEVVIHGEKEQILTQKQKRDGIVVSDAVYNRLVHIADAYGIDTLIAST